jgi:hypothetical protein
MKETALGEGVAVPRALIYRGLTLAAAVICEHNFCVMARTLLTVENSFCIMCNFEELRGVACGKKSAYFNFCVRCLIASSVPHRANRYFQVIDAIRRKLFSLSSLYISGGHCCTSDRTGSVLDANVGA